MAKKKRYYDKERAIAREEVKGIVKEEILKGEDWYRVGPKGHPDSRVFPNTPEGKKQANVYLDTMYDKHEDEDDDAWHEFTERPASYDIKDVVRKVGDIEREHYQSKRAYKPSQPTSEVIKKLRKKRNYRA